MIELIVVGRPKSLQSSVRSLDGWRKQVKAAANAALTQGSAADPGQPVYASGPVHAGFHWFCDMGTAGIPDLDNVLKPTFDALEGLAFTDDKQLTDIHATRIVLNSLPHNGASGADYGPWPATLAQHLLSTSGSEEFVYIQVIDPLHPLEVAWLPGH